LPALMIDNHHLAARHARESIGDRTLDRTI
jgi:hypothetical protein